jgi:hypothetical protein
MRKESEGFTYLWQKIPKVSEAELREKVSLIDKIQNTKTLLKNYILQKEGPGTFFENVCRNFLGIEKTENYSNFAAANFITQCCGVNMSLKLLFLHSNLDYFLQTWEPSPMNVAKVSIRIFPKQKRGTLENGFQIHWLTAAGVL